MFRLHCNLFLTQVAAEQSHHILYFTGWSFSVIPHYSHAHIRYTPAKAKGMNMSVFRLHASERLDRAITLYAIWKCVLVTMSVNLFCTLVWMLTFEFSAPGLNMTCAGIFHYLHLWIPKTAWVDVNISHDLHEHYPKVHAEAAGYLSVCTAVEGDRGGRAETMDRYVICILCSSKM